MWFLTQVTKLSFAVGAKSSSSTPTPIALASAQQQMESPDPIAATPVSFQKAPETASTRGFTAVTASPKPLDVADAPLPEPNVPAAGNVAENLDAVSLTIRDFHAALGENPIGSNAEITKALLGNNLKQVKFEIPPGSQINGEGELCDRWGTPYFFHQVSGEKMEVRSAGPDRTMWTADDSQL